MQVFPGIFPVTAECNPSNPVTAGTVNFRETVKCCAQGFVYQRGHGNVFRITVKHLVVDFIAEYNDPVLFGDAGDFFK